MGRPKKEKILDPEVLHFPQRLQEIIGEKSKSIRDFARQCDLSDAAIHSYLKGKSKPGMPALHKMARIGGVSIDWLAYGKGEKYQGPYENTPAVMMIAESSPSHVEYIFRDDGPLDKALHALEEALSETKASLPPHTKKLVMKWLWEYQEENGQKNLHARARELLKMIGEIQHREVSTRIST